MYPPLYLTPPLRPCKPEAPKLSEGSLPSSDRPRTLGRGPYSPSAQAKRETERLSFTVCPGQATSAYLRQRQYSGSIWGFCRIFEPPLCQASPNQGLAGPDPNFSGQAPPPPRPGQGPPGQGLPGKGPSGQGPGQASLAARGARTFIWGKGKDPPRPWAPP